MEENWYEGATVEITLTDPVCAAQAVECGSRCSDGHRVVRVDQGLTEAAQRSARKLYP